MLLFPAAISEVWHSFNDITNMEVTESVRCSTHTFWCAVLSAWTVHCIFAVFHMNALYAVMHSKFQLFSREVCDLEYNKCLLFYAYTTYFDQAFILTFVTELIYPKLGGISDVSCSVHCRAVQTNKCKQVVTSQQIHEVIVRVMLHSRSPSYWVE